MPVIARFIYHENPNWQQPNNLIMLSLCQPIRQTRQLLFVFLIHLTDIRRIAKGSGGHAPGQRRSLYPYRKETEKLFLRVLVRM